MSTYLQYTQLANDLEGYANCHNGNSLAFAEYINNNVFDWHYIISSKLQFEGVRVLFKNGLVINTELGIIEYSDDYGLSWEVVNLFNDYFRNLFLHEMQK